VLNLINVNKRRRNEEDNKVNVSITLETNKKKCAKRRRLGPIVLAIVKKERKKERNANLITLK
jgi:hypothetical protein